MEPEEEGTRNLERGGLRTREGLEEAHAKNRKGKKKIKLNS
jgi:hypothetical protein